MLIMFLIVYLKGDAWWRYWDLLTLSSYSMILINIIAVSVSRQMKIWGTSDGKQKELGKMLDEWYHNHITRHI